MIPDFGLGNVLPPFTANDVVGQFAPRSPYITTMTELVNRFATSPERASILRGFKTFRDKLRETDFINGFQWINGSFVENCETTNGRPPNDIDVVSLLYRPNQHFEAPDWHSLIETFDSTLFNQDYCKHAFKCDAYFIDLDAPPDLVAQQTAYWFGLFSHQRETFRWKGMVQIDLQCDDEAAMQSLAGIEAAW